MAFVAQHLGHATIWNQFKHEVYEWQCQTGSQHFAFQTHSQAFPEAVEVVPGDLSQRNFGRSFVEIQRLAGRVPGPAERDTAHKAFVRAEG